MMIGVKFIKLNKMNIENIALDITQTISQSLQVIEVQVLVNLSYKSNLTA